MSSDNSKRYYLHNLFEASNELRQITGLLIFFALLGGSFVLAAIAGLFHLGIGIAGLGIAISFISFFWILYEGRRLFHRENEEAIEPKLFAIIGQSHTLSLISIFFLFFAYLMWWADDETHGGDTLYGKPVVSVIQEISKQMDSLTLAVRNLKPAILPSTSGTPNTLGPATQPPEGLRQMTGKVTIDIPGWVQLTLIVISIGSVVLVLFGLALKDENFKNIRQPFIVISITAVRLKRE